MLNVEFWTLHKLLKKIASTQHSKRDAKQIKASAFRFSKRSKKCKFPHVNVAFSIIIIIIMR